MFRRIITIVALVFAAVIASGASANAATHQPAPVGTISLSTTGLCMTADNRQPIMAVCAPSAPNQQWVLQNGIIRLDHSDLMIVPVPDAGILRLAVGATDTSWSYHNDHTISDGEAVLTWLPGSESPFLKLHGGVTPIQDQSWYYFTQVGP